MSYLNIQILFVYNHTKGMPKDPFFCVSNYGMLLQHAAKCGRANIRASARALHTRLAKSPSAAGTSLLLHFHAHTS